MPVASSLSHAVLISYQDVGVLLIGASGIGKSDCALELIHMGAKLICDDAPQYYTHKQKLIGSCTKEFQGIMHIRGLGLIHIPSLFGEQAWLAQSPIDLIIELGSHTPSRETTELELLMAKYQQFQYQECMLPVLQLEINANRPMGVLISTAIKQFALRMADNDPCHKLINRT